MTIAMKCTNIEDFASDTNREQAREMWQKLYERISDRLDEAYTEIADSGNYNHKSYLLFADWYAALLEREFGDEFGAHEIRYQADEDEDNFQWQNRAF